MVAVVETRPVAIFCVDASFVLPLEAGFLAFAGDSLRDGVAFRGSPRRRFPPQLVWRHFQNPGNVLPYLSPHSMQKNSLVMRYPRIAKDSSEKVPAIAAPRARPPRSSGRVLADRPSGRLRLEAPPVSRSRLPRRRFHAGYRYIEREPWLVAPRST